MDAETAGKKGPWQLHERGGGDRCGQLENGGGGMDMAQAEKIMSDKRQVTISDLHTALQSQSSQMQKADFYTDGIFKTRSKSISHQGIFWDTVILVCHNEPRLCRSDVLLNYHDLGNLSNWTLATSATKCLCLSHCHTTSQYQWIFHASSQFSCQFLAILTLFLWGLIVAMARWSTVAILTSWLRTCSLGMLCRVGPSGLSSRCDSDRSMPKWMHLVLWSIRICNQHNLTCHLALLTLQCLCALHTAGGSQKVKFLSMQFYQHCNSRAHTN